MSQSTLLQIDVVRGHKPARTRSAKPARHFYRDAAAVLLMLMVAGFHPFSLPGEGMAGRKISPQLLTLVVIHGAAMTAWVLLFLVQTVAACRFAVSDA